MDTVHLEALKGYMHYSCIIKDKMQSIETSTNAGSDGGGTDVVDIDSKHTEALMSPETVPIVKMDKTQKPIPRWRRRGARYYIVITLLVLVTAALILYYGPFSNRRTVPKSRLKGSGWPRTGQNGRQDRIRKLPQSQLDLAVQRLKGLEQRTLARKLPLGRVTERPGRGSSYDRNRPYGQNRPEKVPFDWYKKEQEKILQGLRKTGGRPVANSPSTSKSTPRQSKLITTRPYIAGKINDKNPSVKDKLALGQKSYGRNVPPVKVSKNELVKIYGMSSSTNSPFASTGSTRIPDDKTLNRRMGNKFDGNVYGVQAPRNLPKLPLSKNQRQQTQEIKPGSQRIQNQGWQNGQQPRVDDGRFAVNAPYGQDRQDRKGPPSQQFGRPSQQSGQQGNNPFGNQFDNNGQPPSQQKLTGIRNKLYEFEKVGEKYDQPYKQQTGLQNNKFGQPKDQYRQNGWKEESSFGQKAQQDKAILGQPDSRKYGQPGSKVNEQQYNKQAGRFGKQGRMFAKQGQSNLNPDNVNKVPNQPKPKTQDALAQFYKGLEKQVSQPPKQPPPPFGQGQGEGQGRGQKYIRDKQFGPAQDSWTKGNKFGARDQGIQQPKWQNPNNPNRPFGRNQNAPNQPYGNNRNAPGNANGNFFEALGKNSQGGAPTKSPQGGKPFSSTNQQQKTGQYPSQRLEAGYDQSRPSANDKPLRNLAAYGMNKNIPPADSGRKPGKSIGQDSYKYFNGAYQKVSDQNAGGQGVVHDKSSFNKMTGAISNAVDRLLGSTGNAKKKWNNDNYKRSTDNILDKFKSRGKSMNFNNVANTASQTTRNYTFPFLNPNMKIDDRVNDLVSRLSIDEVIEQSVTSYDKVTPGIERLGIKKFNWITECLHGHAGTSGTAFPQAIGLAAAFSKNLVYNVSEAISKEVRGHWNDLQQKTDARVNYGITCFSPTVNILRHPLWGRNQETYGEDPYLTAELAKVYVRGMQGNNGERIRVAAGCKHFAAYSGPEIGRTSFDAKVSKEDLHMTYMPAFKACVEAGSAGLMCSYNRVNGIPSCANKALLTETARKNWGFNGYVVSDAGAIDNIHLKHSYTKTAPQSAAAAVSAGCNLELASSREATGKLKAALKVELVTEDQLRKNVKPLFLTRMRLGEFDPPVTSEYRDLSPHHTIQNQDHAQLAKKAAKMSFVLLKNVNSLLPIRQKAKKVAVIGPFSKATSSIYGSYSPTANAQTASSPFDGLSKLGEKTSQAYGCLSDCNVINEGDVKIAVTDADIVFVCLGTGEKEKSDRTSLSLPGKQMDLLKLVASLVSSNKPIVVLLFNGGPVDINPAISDTRVMAVLECWFPAQSAGDALFETLTGVDIDSIPSGRLPMTWPQSLKQVPVMDNYSMKDRTYRYFKEDPLLAFGYGLTYTKFQYLGARVSPRIVGVGETVSVTVTVRNVGRYDAYEVVQLYITFAEQERQVYKSVPLQQLVGFQRVRVNVNSVATVKFEIEPNQRRIFTSKDGNDRWIPIHGKFQVFAGGQQPHQNRAVPSNVVQSEFEVSIYKSRKLS